MTARWEQAVDYQLSLWKWLRTPDAYMYNQKWAESFLDKGADTIGLDSYLRRILNKLPELTEKATFIADPIYVDRDMMALVEYAMPSFKPEPIQESDIIISNGFALFPYPIWLPDTHGRAVSYRALLWVVVDKINVEENEKIYERPAVIIWLFHDITNEDDYDLEFNSKGFNSRQALNMGENNFLLSHVMIVPLNFPFEKETPKESVLPSIQTFWRLMAQTISVKAESTPSRQVRKRLARHDFTRKVTVVTLRRPHKDHDLDYEPKSIEWNHRWVVNGHWRNQWFPSISMHRQIWISPYVKGPEDKPLELKKMRVFEFVR